ncbi:ribulose-phosphate 3-epimerase [Brachybacterium nesterenkovii]|uniref:ribulose-phosphate 3-epimerase n=1 Tax=Brachybacterium nesterenkovii TaxID=47847 RepID=UPI00321C0BA8
MSTPAINPSVLNSDFMRIGEELDRIAGADRAHIDVMDGHFVPNLTFGPSMVEQMARRSPIPLDAHLMIENADREALAYAEAGAESVTFHLEAANAPVRLARELRRAGVKVGVGLRPATPVEPLLDILGEFDMVLVMTVEPGFGGQSFLESMLPKIRRTRQAISAANLELSIQVDGGIKRETIALAAEAGADVFVAGSAIYSADDAAAEITALRELAAAHACRA